MALQGAISSFAPSATSIAGSGLGAGFSFSPVGLGVAGISALGSIAGGVMNALSSGKAFNRQKELMALQAKLNYDYNKKQTLNQYGWQRQGLESANYNPLLAVQGATGASQQNWSGSPTVSPENFSGLVSDFSNASGALMQQQAFARQLDNLVANTKNVESSTVLNKARTENEVLESTRRDIENSYLPESIKSDIYHKVQTARAQMHSANASMISAEAHRQMVNVDAYNAETNRLRQMQDERYVNQQINYLKHQGVLTDSQVRQIRQHIKWYGYSEIPKILQSLSLSNYLNTGAFRNVVGSGTDLLDSILKIPIPSNPIGF